MNESKTEAKTVVEKAPYEAPQIETILSEDDMQREVAYAGIIGGSVAAQA